MVRFGLTVGKGSALWKWLKANKLRLVGQVSTAPAPKPPKPPAPFTPLKGIDYAWQHPAPAEIKKDGYGFAFRYFSDDHTKDLSLGEAKALHADGIAIGVVWESTSNRALDGYLAGKKDAQIALAKLKAVGNPDGVVYFALDFDVPDYAKLLPDFPVFAIRKLGPVAHYFAGILSVIPVARVGGYGGYYPIKRLFDAKLISYGWQTLAWSGGRWEPRAQVRQVGGAVVGGVKCDLNKAMHPDYGVWHPA